MKTVNTSFNFCFLFFIFFNTLLLPHEQAESHKAMKINNTTKRLSCLGLAHNTHNIEHNIYDTASHSFEMINNNHNNNDYKNDNVVCCVLYVSALFFWKVKWDRRTRQRTTMLIMRFYVNFKVSHKHQQKCIYVNCEGTICIHSGFFWNEFLPHLRISLGTIK